MITLNGGTGNGTLLCTVHIPERETSGLGYCNIPKLDLCLPPSDWFLPPPNGMWYNCELSAYGPRQGKILVGDIQSVNKDSAEFNPCKHSTITGTALYTGSTGAFSPYWRKPAAPTTSGFTSASKDQYLPKLTSRPVTLMSGKCCTAVDSKVRANNGSIVTASLSSTYGGSRLYSDISSLPAHYAPPVLRSTLVQLGDLYESGYWYARGINAVIMTAENGPGHWYRTQWDRPDKTTFIRKQIVEYHNSASYTPASSIGSTGYGYLVDEEQRTDIIKIKYVRSPSPGIFHVWYSMETTITWRGWQPYSYYSGTKTALAGELYATILVLEPGLTPDVYISTLDADRYCDNAKERSKLLYNSTSARKARISAMLDVQELDSNWIENLAGLKGTTDCILPLINGYKAINSGNLGAAKKALAGAYLVYQYQIKPNIADFHDIKENGSETIRRVTKNRFSNERRRGAFKEMNIAASNTTASTSYFTTYHLTLKDNLSAVIWNAFEQLGLEPTLGQFWDLVPFSFVIDWFVKVGPYLRRCETRQSMLVDRDLKNRIESFKVQWPVDDVDVKSMFMNQICTNGKPLVYSWYDRRVFNDFGQIDQLSISNDSGLSSSQMTQGLALLTQMKR